MYTYKEIDIQDEFTCKDNKHDSRKDQEDPTSMSSIKIPSVNVYSMKKSLKQ